MSLLLAMMIVIGVGSLFLGILILSSDIKNNTNKIFALFSLVVVVWTASSYLVDHPIVNGLALFWNKLNLASAISMAIVLFYFSLYFPVKSKFPNLWKYLYSVVSLALILSILFTNLGIKSIEFLAWGTNALSGPLLYPGIIFAVVSIIGLFINIGIKYGKLGTNEKSQIKYLIYGFAISIVIGLSCSVLLPLITGNYEFAKYAPIGMLFLLGFTTYAIIEKGFLNTKVILTELAVAIVFLALLVQALLSENTDRGFINGLILIVASYGGYLIIASVKKEITQNKKLQHLTHQLEKDKRELVELDRMKDEFLQMATHELNTPITVIQGKLDMALREDYCHLDKEQKDYFMPVLTDTDRLARLSKDILNVARIDQHRLTVNRSETDLDQLITSIVDGLQIKAKDKSISLEYIKPGKDLPKITIDQSKIGEVITNLVNNAIKFTDKGGVTVKAKDEGENVTVSVKDSGIGIDTNDQKHLFNKFYQAGRFDPNNPQEQQGTGLGLYISKNIIELHGGKIGLESEKDKGSTFYFSLPKEYNGSKAENGKLHCDESAVRVL